MPIHFPMELPPALLQFLGSLVAILALAGIALWMKLGEAEHFSDAQSVRDAAHAAEYGFSPVQTVIAEDGRAALAKDAQGRIMLLRAHGNKIAGRILGPAAAARTEGETLIIHSGERRFGEARLVIANSSVWMQSIEGIDGAEHA